MMLRFFTSQKFGWRLHVRHLSDRVQQTRPRRALLYMPGDNMKMMQKATSLDVDTICFDLEDAVTYDRKAEARQSIKRALHTLVFGASEVMYRINPVGSGLESDDLAEILSSPVLPHGIVIPKVNSPDDILYVSDMIEDCAGPRGASIKMLALIESPEALIRLDEICKACPERLDGLIFGADDYAAAVGAVRSPSNSEVSYARSLMLLHAKANKLQAIDVVNINFHDEEALVAESLEGFRMGYTGKQIIHPNQIDPVQKCFSPDLEIVKKAQKILEAQKQNEGKGAFTVDGQMIDMPTIKNAERILANARACGILSDVNTYNS